MSKTIDTAVAHDPRFIGTALESHTETYVHYLTCRGYSPRTIRSYLCDIAHFSHWFTRQSLVVDDMDEGVIDRFLHRHLPRCHCSNNHRSQIGSVRAALRRLLECLRSSGRASLPSINTETAAERELKQFAHHMIQVCGLAKATRYCRLNDVRAFLHQRFGAEPIALGRLDQGDIERFIRRYTEGWTPQARSRVYGSLRGYFRFKALSGQRTEALLAALPPVAGWRHARLPQVVAASEINRLLAAFDRSSSLGRRDYAIARCLVDLGLRSAEVQRLTLDDIDWRNGTISIHGKGRRTDLMPLPGSVGRALTQYLRHGRPTIASRVLFVRHRAPLDVLITVEAVRARVRCAAKRSGVSGLVSGPHLLRHTAAQCLIQGGATLKNVADFLRHRCLDTTTIYTKLDMRSLAEVAVPWPGRLP
jgi:site-specific recombinase XerD